MHRRLLITYCVPEVNVTSANTGALHVQKDLANLEVSAPLHFLKTGLCLSNPEVVLWVRVNTDVCLCRRNGCSGAHLAALCLKSDDWEEKMRVKKDFEKSQKK